MMSFPRKCAPQHEQIFIARASKQRPLDRPLIKACQATHAQQVLCALNAFRFQVVGAAYLPVHPIEAVADIEQEPLP